MSVRSQIRYADDEFGVSTITAWLDVLDSRLIRQGFPPAPRPVGEDPSAEPVIAVMNHARWLGECGCGSAVMLLRDAAWFWCPTCQNSGTGRLRPVIWPAELDRINRDKASLPEGLAHWTPESEAAWQALRGMVI